jgi:hypothetical protein
MNEKVTPKTDKEIMRNYGFTIDKVEMNDMIRLNDMMKEARQDERATIRSKVEGLMCKPDHDCDVNVALKKVLKIIDGGETQKGKRSGEQYSPACKDSNPSVEGKPRKGNCLPRTSPEKPSRTPWVDTSKRKVI